MSKLYNQTTRSREGQLSHSKIHQSAKELIRRERELLSETNPSAAPETPHTPTDPSIRNIHRDYDTQPYANTVISPFKVVKRQILNDGVGRIKIFDQRRDTKAAYGEKLKMGIIPRSESVTGGMGGPAGEGRGKWVQKKKKQSIVRLPMQNALPIRTADEAAKRLVIRKRTTGLGHSATQPCSPREMFSATSTPGQSTPRIKMMGSEVQSVNSIRESNRMEIINMSIQQQVTKHQAMMKKLKSFQNYASELDLIFYKLIEDNLSKNQLNTKKLKACSDTLSFPVSKQNIGLFYELEDFVIENELVDTKEEPEKIIPAGVMGRLLGLTRIYTKYLKQSFGIAPCLMFTSLWRNFLILVDTTMATKFKIYEQELDDLKVQSKREYHLLSKRFNNLSELFDNLNENANKKITDLAEEIDELKIEKAKLNHKLDKSQLKVRKIKDLYERNDAMMLADEKMTKLHEYIEDTTEEKRKQLLAMKHLFNAMNRKNKFTKKEYQDAQCQTDHSLTCAYRPTKYTPLYEITDTKITNNFHPFHSFLHKIQNADTLAKNGMTFAEIFSFCEQSLNRGMKMFSTISENSFYKSKEDFPSNTLNREATREKEPKLVQPITGLYLHALETYNSKAEAGKILFTICNNINLMHKQKNPYAVYISKIFGLNGEIVPSKAALNSFLRRRKDMIDFSISRMTNLHGIYECNSTIALPFLMEFMKRGADKHYGIIPSRILSKLHNFNNKNICKEFKLELYEEQPVKNRTYLNICNKKIQQYITETGKNANLMKQELMDKLNRIQYIYSNISIQTSHNWKLLNSAMKARDALKLKTISHIAFKEVLRKTLEIRLRPEEESLLCEFLDPDETFTIPYYLFLEQLRADDLVKFSKGISIGIITLSCTLMETITEITEETEASVTNYFREEGLEEKNFDFYEFMDLLKLFDPKLEASDCAIIFKETLEINLNEREFNGKISAEAFTRAFLFHYWNNSSLEKVAFNKIFSGDIIFLQGGSPTSHLKRRESQKRLSIMGARGSIPSSSSKASPGKSTVNI